MPEIPITSALGYVGVFLLLFGFFLIVSGMGILTIEKVTIKSGKKTLITGIFAVVVGVLFLLPEISKSVPLTVSPTSETPTVNMAVTLATPSTLVTPLQSTSPVQTETPFSHDEQPPNILWIRNCDPRKDSEICRESSDLKIFDQFYSVITTINASLSYKMPLSVNDLDIYDVVIANFCTFDVQENIIGWLKSYVTSGGSVIALGDNFCQGVGVINGEWVSSAQAATLFTQNWGISFTDDDDAELQWADPILVHPLNQNISKIYATRHAYLIIKSPSQTIVQMGDKPFIGLYNQTGTVVAIPDIGFHWGIDAYQEIANSDNFTFWRNMFNWLSEQSRNKRK